MFEAGDKVRARAIPYLKTYRNWGIGEVVQVVITSGGGRLYRVAFGGAGYATDKHLRFEGNMLEWADSGLARAVKKL